MMTSRAWKNARSANKRWTSIAISRNRGVDVARRVSTKLVKTIAASAKLFDELLVDISLGGHSSGLRP
jgi:hypothetical protein